MSFCTAKVVGDKSQDMVEIIKLKYNIGELVYNAFAADTEFPNILCEDDN
ncbi:MAG TPA: hypothetical protein PLG67_10065 [Bacillota bacterium]|jgi:hypothetical protein|nr:hypothetical protein [Bacillota bacterium]HQJ37791.1 hypothetical protein [Bacillota bacterium]HQL36923.1 hypothetical protein [Bacillota bacterium]HRU40445.1 hypothetical protein [Candidatus Diapherotrites archaeon]